MNAIPPLRITASGIYDLPADVYHADPCPIPSLSAGMINDILSAPAKCRVSSRRLNPDWAPPENEDKFSIGSASHIMFLEPSRFREAVAVLDFADWKKKEAQQLKAEARSDGLLPLLKHQHEQVKAARAAFLANPFAARAFSDGAAEQSVFWQQDALWCRIRPDFIADVGHLCDYKSTANADPREFGRHAYKLGYHRRAAFYLAGMEAIGRPASHYWFVNQEPKPPYLTSVVELNDDAIEAGHAENALAAEIFRYCLSTDDWFGYRPGQDWTRDVAFKVGLPAYALMQIDERTA